MSTVQQAADRLRPGLLRVRAGGPLFHAAAAFLVLIVLVAILAPLIAPHDPLTVDILNPEAGSSAENLLGTDADGRDLLSRLIWGARPSLLGPALVVVASLLAGTAITLVAIWVGGWFDEVVARVLDVLFALPGLLLAIVAVALFGTGLTTCAIALAIAYTPYMARVVRGPALQVRRRPYVAAYELQGFTGMRIALRHVLPAIRPYLAAQSAIGFGYAMLDIAALSFLGLAVQTPHPDWGSMVASGKPSILSGSPQEALYASLLIVLTIVAVNIVGERLAQEAEEVR